jgi:hypothetical protein
VKWIVEGANPQTGRELAREVEAMSPREAEQIASGRGMLVAKVKAAPLAALPYESPQEGLPLLDKPISGPVFICPNPNCGYRGPSSRQKLGNDNLAVLLFLLGIIPGILYVAFFCGHRDSCPNCGNEVKLP